MKKHPYYGYEPEVGDLVNGRKIVSIVRYGIAGQVWFVILDGDENETIIEHSSGSMQWRCVNDVANH